MKNILFFLLLCNSLLTAQHTFSIVAADPITKEVGSAGATCLDNIILNGEEGALTISDIIPGKGAINTQAFWSPLNMAAALERMELGDSPDEIIEWLKNNDNGAQGGNINDRQYGIVDITDNATRAAAFTGNSNFAVAGDLVGPNYAIQGNILIDEDVLNDMEEAFLNTNGTLADKIMAAMQGAKRPGADQRCLSEGVSSLSAFIRVAHPDDTDASYGNLSLDINIGATPFGVEPIDELQKAYDEYLLTLSNENTITSDQNIKVYPNPSPTKVVTIESSFEMKSISVYNIKGQLLDVIIPQGSFNTEVDLSNFSNNFYLLEIQNSNSDRRYIQHVITQ